MKYLVVENLSGIPRKIVRSLPYLCKFLPTEINCSFQIPTRSIYLVTVSSKRIETTQYSLVARLLLLLPIAHTSPLALSRTLPGPSCPRSIPNSRQQFSSWLLRPSPSDAGSLCNYPRSDPDVVPHPNLLSIRIVWSSTPVWQDAPTEIIAPRWATRSGIFGWWNKISHCSAALRTRNWSLRELKETMFPMVAQACDAVTHLQLD